jgi:type IV secretion system protein VirB10
MTDKIEGGAEALAPGWDERQRPAVGAGGRPRDMWLISGGAVLMGLITVFWLGERRTVEAAETGGVKGGQGYVAAPQVPAEIANFATSPAPATASSIAATAPSASTATPSPAPPPYAAGVGADPATVAAQSAEAARLKAAALVVDLGDQTPSGQAAGASAGSAAAAPARTVDAGAPIGGGAGLNGEEQFAHRVGAQEPDRSEATRIDNLHATIAQGTMIPGVLETALDSDLPGYTRAIVSRDVRGFDGTEVLIPRGSRVIGEYKNAPAEGQSRAFIVWTRIIRPDGVSIQIGSSGTDPLGRAGLAGSVNNHVIQRFGGAILLSLLDAGITSLAREPSTEVVIGSTASATTGVLGSAIQPSSISPTIKVAQGAPIRIFVARDLDFSSVGRADR